MLVRSLKIVNFRGLADVSVRDLREVGLHGVPVAQGVDPASVAEAIRFAFTGALPPGETVSPAAGFAYVEAAFTAAGDARASVFRGLDRRGALQVSLREDGGMRITSGESEVAARLEELLGCPIAAWDRSTFLPAAHSPGSSRSVLDALADPAPSEPAPSAVVPTVVPSIDLSAEPAPANDPPPGAEIEPARAALAEEADTVRRAVRSRTLEAQIDSGFEQLGSLGRRVRRERSDTAEVLDRCTAEREKIRARLRRVNEYRDLVSSQRVAPVAAPAAARRGASHRIEWGVGLCALALLGLLGYVTVAGDDSPGTLSAKKTAGVGFLVAAGSYLWLASKHGDPRGRRVASLDAGDPALPAAPSAGEDPSRVWKESLRARFSDLGDPDDPALVTDLRARLSSLDEDAAPVQSKIEKLDEVLALHDVEIGRAARAIHRSTPQQDEAPQGLGDGETPESAGTSVADLGDRIYQHCVERDALAARGTKTVEAALEGLRGAFLGVASAAGAPDAAAGALSRAGLASLAAERQDPQGAESEAEGVLGNVLREADRIFASSAAERVERARSAALAQMRDAPPGPLRLTLPTTPATPSDMLRRAAGPWLVALTLGRFHGLDVAQDGEIVLTGASGERVRWSDADARTREKVSLGLLARSGEARLAGPAGLTSPRVIVLSGRAGSIGDDASLGRFLSEHAPSATQVLYGASPSVPAPAVRTRPVVPLRGAADDARSGSAEPLPKPILPVRGTLPTPRSPRVARPDAAASAERPSATGWFELTRTPGGPFSFVLKSGTAEVILRSELFESRQAAENGIASVQRSSALEARYERLPAKDGRVYFVLKASNGQVIGTSRLYQTPAGREAGIEAVMRHGPVPDVRDDS